MAAQNRRLVDAAVAVFEDVIGYVIAQFVAVHVRVGEVVQIIRHPVFHRVEKEQIAGAQIVQFQRAGGPIQKQHIRPALAAQRKGNTPKELRSGQVGHIPRRAQTGGQGGTVAVEDGSKIDGAEMGRGGLHWVPSLWGIRGLIPDSFRRRGAKPQRCRAVVYCNAGGRARSR